MPQPLSYSLQTSVTRVIQLKQEVECLLEVKTIWFLCYQCALLNSCMFHLIRTDILKSFTASNGNPNNVQPKFCGLPAKLESHKMLSTFLEVARTEDIHKERHQRLMIINWLGVKRRAALKNFPTRPVSISNKILIWAELNRIWRKNVIRIKVRLPFLSLSWWNVI